MAQDPKVLVRNDGDGRRRKHIPNPRCLECDHHFDSKLMRSSDDDAKSGFGDLLCTVKRRDPWRIRLWTREYRLAINLGKCHDCEGMFSMDGRKGGPDTKRYVSTWAM